MGRLLTVVLLLWLVLPLSAVAQDCSERSVRSAVQNHSAKSADDVFFWSGAFAKPITGKDSVENASRELAEKRKNFVATLQPEKIVVSKAGDMAYEYGTGDISYDDPASGNHVAFQNAYLRVWKAVDGECKVAALMARPIGK